MSNRTLNLTDALYEYMLDVSLREPEVMRRLRAETARHPKSEMQIAPEQGQFMALLVRLMGATRALEIGTFTGYSALAVARALPADGQLIACDISAEYTAIARRYWETAGVADRIDLRIAPALETLAILRDEGQAGTFDFAFIDADKEAYDAYYEHCLALLRPRGLVVLDNTFRDGRVVNAEDHSESVQAIHRLNEKLRHDDRIHLSLLPVADGLTLALKQ